MCLLHYCLVLAPGSNLSDCSRFLLRHSNLNSSAQRPAPDTNTPPPPQQPKSIRGIISTFVLFSLLQRRAFACHSPSNCLSNSLSRTAYETFLRGYFHQE